MRQMGLQGAVRGRPRRTTISSDDRAARPKPMPSADQIGSPKIMIVAIATPARTYPAIAVWKTGRVQAAVMSLTFVFTQIIPLQYAVLVGMAFSSIPFLSEQSNKITLRRLLVGEHEQVEEVDPPAEVGTDEVIVLQPCGSMFFAAAPLLEDQLPAVTRQSVNSVVVFRLRGRTDLGSTLMEILIRYAEALIGGGSKLMLLSASEQVQRQLDAAGVTDVVDPDDIYATDQWLGATVRGAHRNAEDWIASHPAGGT